MHKNIYIYANLFICAYFILTIQCSKATYQSQVNYLDGFYTWSEWFLDNTNTSIIYLVIKKKSYIIKNTESFVYKYLHILSDIWYIFMHII